MLLEHIRFTNRQALKIAIKSRDDIGQAIQSLGLVKNRPVIVLIGGASGIKNRDFDRIYKAVKIIALIAQDLNAAVIDGGTHSGVMADIGQIRKGNNYNYPLIGVAAQGTVKWPGRKMGVWERLTFNRDAEQVDPNHTHFLLVPGKNWGDESPWISDAATQLSGNKPSVAVLINGGIISRDKDVPNNLGAGRPVLVLEGIGRTADELAKHHPNTSLMRDIQTSNLDHMMKEIKYCLNPEV